MKQVSESRVTEALDEMGSRGSSNMALDMACGAVHLAFLVGLIGSIEFSRRCKALAEARFGPKKIAVHTKEQA